MIKTIFFDVDGTLVSHNTHSMPESSIQAIESLKQKGIQVVIATGRSKMDLRRMPVNQVQFDSYITLNGQMTLDRDMNLLDGYPLSKQTQDHIVSMFNNKEHPIMLLEEDRMYINYIDDYVKIAEAAVSSPLPVLGTYDGATLYQAIPFVSQEVLDTFKDDLPHSKVTRWNEYGVDIIDEHGGKLEGVRKFMLNNHLSKEECMAFGDGENDIAMLEEVGIGIAMGNASDEVKEIANYITTDIDHDGILNALKHFKLL